MVAHANTGNDDYYEVEVEDQLRRIHTPPVTRRATPLPLDPFSPEASRASSPSHCPTAPTPAEALPMRRLIWRAIKRTLNYWFPPDPPNVIAIIRLPERIYCAHCGTVRVSKYCPACGVNVDRQFKKMVLKMAEFVVEGTDDRRRDIAHSVQEQVDLRMAELTEQLRQRVESKLAMLERTYVMQIVKQKKAIDHLLQSGAPRRLPAPDLSMKDFDASGGTRRLAEREMGSGIVQHESRASFGSYDW